MTTVIIKQKVRGASPFMYVRAPACCVHGARHGWLRKSFCHATETQVTVWCSSTELPGPFPARLEQCEKVCSGYSEMGSVETVAMPSGVCIH